MLKDAPDEDIAEIIASAVEERANELRQNFSLDTLNGVDKFYVNEENESVTWAYFNPDSSAGGQLVYALLGNSRRSPYNCRKERI